MWDYSLAMLVSTQGMWVNIPVRLDYKSLHHQVRTAHYPLAKTAHYHEMVTYQVKDSAFVTDS